MTVRGIVFVFAATSVYAISVDQKVRHHLALLAFVFVLLWLFEATLVVWGYLWAWILFLLSSVAGIVQAPWDWHGPIPISLNVALLVLLLAPETRRYIGIGKRPAPAQNA